MQEMILSILVHFANITTNKNINIVETKPMSELPKILPITTICREEGVPIIYSNVPINLSLVIELPAPNNVLPQSPRAADPIMR